MDVASFGLALGFGLNAENFRTPTAFIAGARLFLLAQTLLAQTLLALTYAVLCAPFGGTLGDFFGFAVICAAMALLGWGMAIVRRKSEH